MKNKWYGIMGYRVSKKIENEKLKKKLFKSSLKSNLFGREVSSLFENIFLTNI